ncbi:hypothetical protein JXA84_08670 [candidate division WOR-3 bacterium]|nr:hypothetical protein [candidate division WOR-3 bacterium]
MKIINSILDGLEKGGNVKSAKERSSLDRSHKQERRYKADKYGRDAKNQTVYTNDLCWFSFSEGK